MRNGKEKKISEGQVSHRWKPENVGGGGVGTVLGISEDRGGDGKERKVSEGQVSHRWKPENVGGGGVDIRTVLRISEG